MKNLLLTALIILSSLGLFADNLTVEKGRFGVDHNLKLIVINMNAAEINTSSDSKSGIILDQLYEFQEDVKSFSNGNPYLVKNADGVVYKLYITQLPVVTINTDGPIVNSPAVHGVFSIVDSDGTVINMDAGFKIRGTSSQQYDKKSYRIEFWADASGSANMDTTFLGMRSDDDWNLEAMYNQPLRLRNNFANKLWQEIHKVSYYVTEPDAISGVRMEYVDVFLNDSYIGVYTISERIDRKQLSLKKYNGETRGELYKGNGDGAPTFTALPNYNNSLDTWDNFEWIYPNEDPSLINWSNLYNLVDFVMNSDDATFYAQYKSSLELQNLVDYYLYINTIKAMDNMGRNIFFARFNQAEPYFFVPWDMDACLGLDLAGNQSNDTDDLMTNALYDKLIMDCASTGFVNALKTRYNTLRNSSLTTNHIMTIVQELYDFLKNDGAYDRESEAWPDFVLDETQLSYISSWLDVRFNYLDHEFNKDCGTWDVEEIENEDVVSVFPNPAKDRIIVVFDASEEVEVNVFNVNGQLIHSESSISGSIQISTERFSKGLYLVQMRGEGWERSEKVVVE